MFFLFFLYFPLLIFEKIPTAEGTVGIYFNSDNSAKHVNSEGR